MGGIFVGVLEIRPSIKRDEPLGQPMD